MNIVRTMIEFLEKKKRKKRKKIIHTKHSWKPAPDFEDDWEGVDKSEYCTKCGVIRHIMLSGTEYKFYRFYREWLGEFGWGVMMAYDAVLAKDKAQANSMKPSRMYSYEKQFESITKVEPEHLFLNEEELSKIYGIKDS